MRYLNVETSASATCLYLCTTSSEQHRATSAKPECPGGTNSWRTKPLMSKNSGNFLTTPLVILKE
jgi:hypothetical protein